MAKLSTSKSGYVTKFFLILSFYVSGIRPFSFLLHSVFTLSNVMSVEISLSMKNPTLFSMLAAPVAVAEGDIEATFCKYLAIVEYSVNLPNTGD